MLFLLGMLQAFAPVSIDMYLPAMPQMEQVFHTSAAAVQYTMVTFLVGFALGQSLYGPITDRFGRKPPLYASLVLFIASSAACALAPSIRIMSFFRLLQAIGACGGSVISRAIVRDLFPPSELRRIFSMLILVVGVSPVIAPLFGSYLLLWFGWQAAFVTQALIGVACFGAMHFRLPESLPREARRPLRLDTIVSAYSRLIKDRTFLGASVVCGFGSAGMFAYITSAPFVFISLYHVPTQQFGWLFGAVAAGMVAASQINGRMSRGIPLWRVLRNANLVQLAAAALLLFAVLTGIGGLATVFAGIF
ncbi:MAG TPA: multidrug effflux MFS transporter, partial [Bryobacteraceae bacterium]